MGMQLADFSQPLREIAPFKFALDAPPKPHPAFETYILQITPKNGLSWIKAVGREIPTSGYGIELRSEFRSMEEKLQKSYGPCEQIDFLMVDSIWDEPKDWMMSLLKRERFMQTSWESKHDSKLTEALESIFLIASAVDTEKGYIAIEYALKNSHQAESEISEAQDDVL